MLQDGSSYPPYDVYAWDAEGRLKSINNGSYTVNLVYNALGQQVEQDAPGQFRLVFPYHTWGEKMGWYDVNAGFFTRYQMLVAGHEVRFYPTNLRYYYHANHLGSGAMVTDNTGAAFGERMYYPYGQNWSTAGAWVTTEFAAFRDSVLGGDDVYVTPNRHYRVDVYRWLSPDPIGKKAASLTDPQTWNMYAYVRNNPASRTDPTGLYDFKNPCENDNKQCNADFKAFQKEFKNSLKEIKHARNTLKKGSAERARLDAVLKSYGKAGDNNGVTVTTGSLPGTAAAATVGSAVTFDTSKNPDAIVMAINAGHEGTHVMDNLDPRSTAAPLPNFSVEYRAYETSAWVGQGLGLSSLSAGGYTIFTSGQGFNDAGASNLIMDTYPRMRPGEIYLDPLPYHDPWDQR